MPGIDIGFTTITYYGIIIMIGAVAAAFLAAWNAKFYREDPEIVWDALAWVLIGGIIGARLWHVFTPPASMVEQGITTWYYLTHPLDLINVRAGGLGIPGAIIGGALALYLFARRRKSSFLVWADIAAPALALGQAIGRWANYVNQEVYGAPTDLPWAITIDPQHRLPDYQEFARYHPLFLYESLWNFFNLFALLWISRHFKGRLLPGDVFLLYLIIYPVGRFFLEFLRLDFSPVAGLNINQIVMAVTAILAIFALLVRHRSNRQGT